jgi:outer membrane protein assembly factor BamE
MLAGCSCVEGRSCSAVITPYRIDIVQGNVVTKDQAAMVKPGMTGCRCATCSARRC